MSSAQIDKVLKVYKRIYQIPSLTAARIVPVVNDGITVQSFWSQKNIERRSKQKFLQEFSFTTDLQVTLEGFPIENSSEILTAFSEDEKLKAILRDVTVDGKSKQFIEIWDRQHLSKSYDLSAYDVHGDVYAEPTFSGFHLSPDSKKLLYVAEKKLPKTEPFYKPKPKSKNNKPKADKNEGEDEPLRGTEYIHKPDWGEQLVGKHRSVVVILNIEDDTIEPITSIPDDHFPAQVFWASNGNDIIGVTYKLETRYLGLYACTNRKSYIFHLRGPEFNLLTAEGLHCISPRLSPDGNHLIWLEREISPAHHNVERLMHLKMDDLEKPEVLIDLVKTEKVIEQNKKFYGLYNQSLPKRCWSSDSKYIFFSTPQRSDIKSYIIDLETKSMTEVENSGSSSLTIVDVKNDFVALAKFSLIEPPQLLIGKFNPDALNIGQLFLRSCTKPLDVMKGENLMYEHNEFVYETNEPVKDFNFTYFGKKGETEKSMPLIAVGHGGPHVNYCNMFYPNYAFLSLLGFGILHINYRGSTGMGGDNVDYLLGKVGDVDVKDCVIAIDTALDKYPWLDPKRINVYGGSHGGFLGAHLSAQFPDKFKTAMLLNPVIDLVSMFATTDIPDWCKAVSGCSTLKNLPSSEDKNNYGQLLLKMLEHSPISHVDKVKTPTFIALGSKDLRVPFSQGKLWYNRLRANNVVAKLFIYEDNHSLRKDEVEFDNDMNTALWLMEYNFEESMV